MHPQHALNQQMDYVHPAPVRVWHWINASGFLFLILTGFQIRYAESINLMTLSHAINLHNYVGFVVIANYFLWLSYYLGSGKIKLYIPDLRRVVGLAIRQARYYGFDFFLGRPNPHTMTAENKFNALQQQAYLVIMLVLLPAQMISGLFLWKVKGYEEYINLLGGIKVIDTIHVLLFFFFTSFLFIHCYLATLGHTPLAHFKAMFTGYENHH
ncbi:cytochrome b/b6 domain-containing protein [Desulfogranum mediterraneum]|uniref:cytochrome b/b6 domain-containing protein n=1 Tax=Desulfogranum mediterraneum TaxID=160661 RepID=UPI000412B345|nr:cytochrome b/b6 domain-containing protein [Desulfogranum mediterraneum]